MNLTIYDDNLDFGGHQVMALAALRGFVREQDISITLLHHPENRRWNEALKGLTAESGPVSAPIRTGPTPATTRRFQGIRNHVAWSEESRLRSFWKAHEADVVLFIQGDVEQASLALRAARAAGLRTISYIPLHHTLAQMGARFGPVRDFFNRSLVDAPDAYITITPSIAAGLRKRGARCPIEVVENGIDWNRFKPVARSVARANLGWEEADRNLGMVGRIEFKQKGQDFLLNTWANHRDSIPYNRLVFVGSGPDEDRLRQQVEALGVSDRVTLTGWLDPVTVYPALDALALPSRFEGLPLVMLEAIACGVPVVGSDRDGMADVLPPSWRFPAFDEFGLCKALKLLPEAGSDEILQLRKSLLDRYDLTRFQENFTRTLRALAHGKQTSKHTRS